MDKARAGEPTEPSSDDLLLFDQPHAPEQQPLRGKPSGRKILGEIFFQERRSQSRVKTDIVVKYLSAWSKIMVTRPPNYKAAYIDLFAGAGRYGDGEPSTPIRVLETLLASDVLSERVVTYFNEGRRKTFEQLKSTISAINNLAKLAYQPVIENDVIDEDAPKSFEEIGLVPSFLFADPWGYKGLTLRLIKAILKDWGSECLFFFNYNRIYMGLNHTGIANHINSIFGEERANALRAYVNQRPQPDAVAREAAVLQALREALTEIAGTFSLPFRFMRSPGRTSHYLIFVTKNRLGHDIMKDIMARASSTHPQGVASFSFIDPNSSPRTELELATPLDRLIALLASEFVGRQVSVRSIFDEHNVGQPYTLTNYKEALKRMRASGVVSCSRPSGKSIREGTMPDDVLVQFPK